MKTLKLIPVDPKSRFLQIDKHTHELVKELGQALQKMYQIVGYQPPWIGYQALDNDRVIGSCSFKSAPVAGRVEIAYFTFPEYEGQGYATQMAGMLLEIAHKEDPRVIVTAQTLPIKNASTSILKKLGFEYVREVMHPEDGLVWEWEYHSRILPEND
jgi:RimJ/RimL family protein N-acetyltransferase